jgi:formylglycine-generating enzyme required for sulfatase activity
MKSKPASTVDPLALLRTSINERKLVAVIGTGVSLALTNGSNRALSWKGLVENGFAHALKKSIITKAQNDSWKPHLASNDIAELLGAAEFISQKLGAPNGDLYARWLESVFQHVQPENKKMEEAVQALRDAGILLCTLNYDDLLEKATGLDSINMDETYKVTKWIRRERAGLLHLHGSWEIPSTCVLGIRDYQAAVNNDVRDFFQRALGSFSRLLFIGCGDTFQDPNFSALIRWLRQNMKTAAFQHYALVSDAEVESRDADPAWQGFVDPIGYGLDHRALPAFLLKHFSSPPVAKVRRQSSANLPATVLGRKTAGQALAHYREDRVEEWSAPRYGAGDKLFTQLSLLLDRGQDADERWVRQKEKFRSLADILKAYPGYPALVLLGDPGAGKSTLLRRLDLDIARTNRNAGTKGEFSYFVSLRDYRGAPGALPPAPMEWLRNKWAEDWKASQPRLPDFDDVLRGKSYLLLDALNEMPLREPSDYQLLVSGWAAFIASVKTRFPKCRMVFSCRSLDYSASLSNPDIQVPHVEIERLDKPTILEFLQHYATRNAASLFEAIEASGQLDLYSTAYFLKMLCDHAGRTGEIPQDRSALFTAFVRELLRRETSKKTRPLVTPGLLSDTDLARLAALFEMANPPWSSPYELPERGPMFPQLASLANTMQTKGGTSGNSQVVLRYDSVQSMLTPVLGQAQAEQFVEAACALTVLEHDRPKGTVQFIHQLMQEYFAARHLAVVPEPQRVWIPWLRADISPSLEEKRASLNINEPLPMLDSTGWEETTLLAVAMAADCGAFLESLIDSNLPLAGRAAAQIQASEAHRGALPDGPVAPRLSSELVARLQTLLLERMVDPKTDLRARIAAGKALGELGDRRFKGKKNTKGKHEYLLPQVIRVPRGTYRIGSDDGMHRHEGKMHAAKLTDFHLARFPVTNAEWDCFMRADGYVDDRWWLTKAAQQWRNGATTRAARDEQWRAFRLMLKENPDYVSRKLATGEISPKAAEDHDKAMHLSDGEFEAALEKDFKESLRKGEIGSRYTEPRRWRNRDFNNPLQPVVGICWYEAQAYCAWLSNQTGQHWRLPTEAEWEAAARLGGSENALYPWGANFDSANCNTFESHIRAPTPVGIFPGGYTAAELVDISGNAYEWTSSKYDKSKYRYPYDKNDGRENPEDVEDDPKDYYPRVLRGGSWYYSKDEARIAFRLRFHPGYHNQSTGMRLVLDGE